MKEINSDIVAIDPNDSIVKCLAKGSDADFIPNYKSLKNINSNIPVIFRSMTQRKTVFLCEEQNRDYFYIDTGYIGNLEKRKNWHRIVKNGMQHSVPKYDLPSDRFDKIANEKDYLPFPGWKKNGSAILVVTPSDKPCLFYGINRDQWVKETLQTLKANTDRPIIIRDKGLRRERIGRNSIYHQLDDDNIFAVVTYNSIAATEAIGFGVPAFTLAPNSADEFCKKDLTEIETPLYSDPKKIIKWQHWLGYCQYTPNEMSNGTAMKLIKEHNLK